MKTAKEILRKHIGDDMDAMPDNDMRIKVYLPAILEAMENYNDQFIKTKSQKRRPGFYWVRIDLEEWVIALWSGVYWHFIGDGIKLDDEDLPEIDEREIIRTNEGIDNLYAEFKNKLNSLVNKLPYKSTGECGPG